MNDREPMKRLTMFRPAFWRVVCLSLSFVSLLAPPPALGGNTTGTTRTQTYQPGEPYTGLPGGSPGRGYGTSPSGLPSVYCQNWPGQSSYPQYPGTGSNTPCGPNFQRQPQPMVLAPDPGAYVRGFLLGIAFCLGAPLQQIWTDGGIYAQIAWALARGDPATAGNILQLKGTRDRQNFDAFIKSFNQNIYGVDPEEAGRRDGSRLCMFGLIPGLAKALAKGPIPRASEERVPTIGPQALRFGDSDLVYGPSAGGALRALQQQAGGRLLTDLPGPPPGMSWVAYSEQVMEQQLAAGGQIRFDLTNVQNISDVLSGAGQWGRSVTAAELRYLRSNWPRFSNNVTFYEGGVAVSPPW
jgi:hypothetical protein